MDKKDIIIGVISVVVIALVIAVFSLSSDVPKVSKDVILTLEGTEYTVDEFQKYKYIKNEADGDITKELTTEELDTMLNGFVETKMYVLAADKKGITIPSEEEETFKTDYSEKSATYSKYGISQEDYIKYARDEYKQNELSSNFSKYYELPDEYYNSFVDSYTDEKKSYEFRMMMFGYDQDVSGDQSGDVSGDVSGDTSGDTEESKNRENVLAKAERVLAEVKASGDFEELAKENASYRITFKGAGYTFSNGSLEYATTPLLGSKLGNDDLYNAVIKLNSGETTEIIEDKEGSAFYFVKVENVQDGFVGEAQSELRKVLLLQYADTLVMQNVKYELNQAALVRALYQK